MYASAVKITVQRKKKQASILPVLCKAFGSTFLFGSALKLVTDLLIFVSPQILHLIIKFVERTNKPLVVEKQFNNASTNSNDIPFGSQREPLWHGILFAAGLFGVAGLQTIFKTHHYHCMSIVGQRIRTAIIGAVYKKALILSNLVRKDSTIGEIVNLLAVDAQLLMDLTQHINMLWSAPLQIGLALYFLWNLLGPSILAGE